MRGPLLSVLECRHFVARAVHLHPEGEHSICPGLHRRLNNQRNEGRVCEIEVGWRYGTGDGGQKEGSSNLFSEGTWRFRAIFRWRTDHGDLRVEEIEAGYECSVLL